MPGTPRTPQNDSPRSELRFLDPRMWRSLYRDVPREHWVIFITAAVALLLHEMVFLSWKFEELFLRPVPGWAKELFGPDGPWWSGLVPWLWWIFGTVLVWIVLPLVSARIFLGLKFSDLGGSFAGLRGKLPPYFVMLAVMLPVVLIAALILPEFRDLYPFAISGAEAGTLIGDAQIRHWSWRVFIVYELCYGLQFLSVEFFFRGFLVNGLGKTMGYRAVLVSVVPYALIHIHKPLPEAFASIIAGIVLGSFALRTRSIWGGLMVHLGVAWGMDFISLAVGGSGGFPTR